MRTKKIQPNKNQIERLIQEIVITEQEGAHRNIMKDLYKMRYGKDWKEYYSTS